MKYSDLRQNGDKNAIYDGNIQIYAKNNPQRL